MQLTGGAAAGAAQQYDGGTPVSPSSTPVKLPAEGGNVKKLSQKFGGSGVFGKVGSFVKVGSFASRRASQSQDSILVQGTPTQPTAAAPAAPYLYAGQVASPPRASPPPSSPPPSAAILDVDDLPSSSQEASTPKHKKPGYVPPKQWRPPLQMLLHQHNGRIIAIPHVDVRPHGQSAPACSSPREPTPL